MDGHKFAPVTQALAAQCQRSAEAVSSAGAGFNLDGQEGAS